MPMFRETEEFSIFSIMSDDSPSIENKIIRGQVEVDLRKIIDELPADQKEVLMMRMYQDMSFKEISEITGVSINTALGRMRYALMNMRKVIDKHQIILTNWYYNKNFCVVIKKPNLYYFMAKIYSKKTVVTNSMKPKKETISFLLNYSKALSIIKVNDRNFEIIAN